MAASGRVARFRLTGSAGDPERTYWETVVAPVRTSNGAITGLLATSSDVTAEVERESLLNTALQLLPSPLAVKDVESGAYILWNHAAELAFGVSSDEVIGAGSLDLLGSDLATAFANAEMAAVRSGERQRLSIDTIVGATHRAFDLQTFATFDDFGARHLISLCNDVSERQAASAALKLAAERAEQANEAKSRFLANMSHELRTPMNGIVAGADMLARHGLPVHSQELVSLIRGSSATLERLLSGILDLVAIEDGGMKIELAPFPLGDLVRQVFGLARLQADEKSVDLRVSIGSDADVTVLGDAMRVGQVLTNLMNNAVKFTEQGHVQLEVGRDGDQVRFLVRDTGIGFYAGVRAHIFERFQQGDSSITRRFGGSGLGLAISRELVGLMGGRIDCESQPGVGSQFWFDLPLPIAVNAVANSAECDRLLAPQDLRILAADDHPTNRRVVELLLEGKADVVSVADGQQAVDAYRAGPFDLILMDMQMPVMDGVSAVREIRAIERRSGRPASPILMLSANVAPEQVAASQAAGANLHIGKPITADRLFAAIEELLD
jgi:PAS domain S-box-containing protein